MATHRKPAKAAGKLLADQKTSKTVKKVAASDLAQAEKQPPKKQPTKQPTKKQPT